MKRIITLLSLLVLVGCSESRHLDRAQQEAILNTKMDALRNCMWNHVLDYDDMISDASHVALALAGRCNYEYSSYVNSVVDATDISEIAKKRMVFELQSDQNKISNFMPVVLKARAQVRDFAAKKNAEKK